ncbi:MAG TPA: hypothetical protein VK447_21015, partial [Myxococcaceae bacterium]|nr:hypothetical protein [Myxococcaceae bacterium]
MTPTLFRIELTRSTSAVDPFAFQWNGPQRYTLRHEDGPGEATFGWEPEVFAALAELADPSPSQERLARLGHKLREFLLSAFSRVAKNWSDFEQRLLEAEAAQKRVYLIFRFGAAELFALPWEQLVLGNGRLLGSVRGCIPQYEWLGASKTHP